MSSSSSTSSSDESSTATTTNPSGVSNNAAVSIKPDLNADSTVSTPEQASGVWRQFEELSQQLFKHSHAYSDIDKTLDCQNALELKVQAQQERIRQLELTQQSQISTFETRYLDWIREKESLEADKKGVEAVLTEKHQQKMLQVDRELRGETERVNSLKRKLERADSQLKLVEKHLEVCMGRLQGWEQFTTQLKEVDFVSLEGQLTQLFRDCYDLVVDNFGVDLPAEALADYSKWEKQVNDLNLPLRFPPTNSPAAKSVRQAAALNVIANSLCDNVFKPCFVPESAADSKTIKTILASMADLRKEEQFTRAILISIYPPEQVTAAINRAIDATSTKILESLHVFLGDRKSSFKTGLLPLLETAAAISREMQQSKKMVEANLDDADAAERSEEYLPDFGDLRPSSTRPAKFEMLYLFPRFYVAEDDRVVHGGEILWPEQEAVLLAEQELREFKAGKRAKHTRGVSGSGAGREPKQERRPSTVVSAENRSLPPSPTSPRTARFAA